MDPRPPRTRPITATERSGVIAPGNLERYQARWITPAGGLEDVVDRYWSVRWALPADERIRQRILTHPAVTLSVEAGDVPARLVVTGVHHGAWQRDIHGRGHVFALRLRPAGLAVVSDLAPGDVADATLPVTRDLDARLHDLLDAVADQPDDDSRARVADTLLADLLRTRPVRPVGRLANAAVDELTASVHTRTGARLSARLGSSERTLQRALRDTLGQGPKWIARWVRLQEATRLLSQEPAPPLAEVAHSLGYTDQAHLTNDFRDAVGLTPGAYLAALRQLG
ncbi:MAG TPA: helix-turn-helix domain-containing protein [Ornithinibacter sp.]|nr:helix-turn-helix domain-containing protein [Ornithinibacter sp.]